ncbi:MAG: peptidoglycan editing factor PgeF [Phycisphaerae bacterium]
MELIQTASPDGVVYFTSPTLTSSGFVHGFSTRLGGISPPPFESLNLGNAAVGPQDRAENIGENQKRFLGAIGAEDFRLITVRQVHGADVAIAGGTATGEGESNGNDFEPCADALVVQDAGLLAGMRTADCVPILIGSLDGRIAAAVHAGWRGLVSGVIGACIRRMEAVGVPASELAAAIGPCISGRTYEVGPEVAAAFEQAGLRAAVKEYSKPHINLNLATRIELVHAGITQIDASELCTSERAELFYSHRRDRGTTGRLLAAIGLPRERNRPRHR